MSKWIALTGVVTAAALAMATEPRPVVVPPTHPATKADLEDLSWLAGSWTDDTEGVRNEEHWMAPFGGIMVGMNRTAKKDRLAMFEYLRIEQRRDGVVFVASPRGGKATEFKATEIGEDHVVFENPRHDYPQKISYRLEDETLHAAISGEQDGKPSEGSWSWQRGDLVPED